MGLFDLFARRPALSEGLEQYRNTSGAVLLDVRTPENTGTATCPERKTCLWTGWIPSAEPAGSPLFVYCRSGARSARQSPAGAGGVFRHRSGGLLGYRGPLEA